MNSSEPVKKTGLVWESLSVVAIAAAGAVGYYYLFTLCYGMVEQGLRHFGGA
ncbi:MAG: hypothetical protein K2Y32_20465 [Candidatus Obscuribacterales bacterium]|nr:hypothetical protein [Candidatus Obscuribacterales bacterium]